MPDPIRRTDAIVPIESWLCEDCAQHPKGAIVLDYGTSSSGTPRLDLHHSLCAPCLACVLGAAAKASALGAEGGEVE